MSLITYLWHYTLARLLYDDVVRPLGPASVALVGALAVALVLTCRRGRRR